MKKISLSGNNGIKEWINNNLQLSFSELKFCTFKTCKCKCRCLQSEIPLSSADFTIYTTGKLSRILSHLFWEEFSTFSAANTIHNFPIFHSNFSFFTYYCWVGRGSMELEVCLTLLHITSSGNRTPDLLILRPMPYPLVHMLPLVILWYLLLLKLLTTFNNKTNI